MLSVPKLHNVAVNGEANYKRVDEVKGGVGCSLVEIGTSMPDNTAMRELICVVIVELEGPEHVAHRVGLVVIFFRNLSLVASVLLDLGLDPESLLIEQTSSGSSRSISSPSM
jgi:hypothetical protein